jgi:predicted nucleotidyltransferase
MKKYTREDYYDAVNELIEVITKTYRNGLKAIYAGGSFARGDFVPGRSDVDIYIVAENRKEELQRELQGEALKIEKKRFTDLRSILDEVLGISVTTLKEIREGTSFLGSGFEYSNFIKEGKLLWGEDIKTFILEPSQERQKESAKNNLGKVYEIVSNQEKYFKWLKWIPFVFVPKAKKERWTRQAFNLIFRTAALFLGSKGVYVSKKEDIASAFKQHVKEEKLRKIISYASSLWEKWKNEPLNNKETKQLLGNSIKIVKGLQSMNESEQTP